MKQLMLFMAVFTTLAVPGSRGDTLELKNGRILKGRYIGGTAGTLRFETSEGVQVMETRQALALTFTAGKVTTSASAAPSPTRRTVAVPAGTTLLVRMVDSVSSRDPVGKRFTTTLESDLRVDGTLVAAAGTKVYGRVSSAEQARRYTGQSVLDLRLTEIAIGPNLVQISTGGHAAAGANSLGKTARGAAAGAAIGAIADGGSGAGKGAAIGAVASGIKKGETISVGSSTLLEFKLREPVSVKVGN